MSDHPRYFEYALAFCAVLMLLGVMMMGADRKLKHDIELAKIAAGCKE